MKSTKDRMLGFGCMRMPTLEAGKPDSFDFEKVEAMFDAYIGAGFTYFDTAYTYHGYQAEKAVRKALVERHPRDAFQLATKMPLRDFKNADDLETIFAEQLTNCGVEFFDCYLLHNVCGSVYEKCRKYNAFHFLSRKKAEGKAKSVGISFHDSPKLLDSILAANGDSLDFVQLQVNYVDMEQPNIRARECLAVAAKYGKPVFVMEPCKGGTLVNIPEEAERLMRNYAPDASIASWAMRFAASQPGVVRVLSGMSTMEQVSDNCRTFSEFTPLSEGEAEVIHRVANLINAQNAIPCTACEYCTHGCPKQIAIPQCFAIYNNIMRATGSFSSHHVYYGNLAAAGHGKAGDCIKCGKCEQVCPQHLPIREYLEKVAEKFENTNFFPTRAKG